MGYLPPMSRRDPEVVSSREYERGGRTYRERVFASGSTSTEIVATLGDHLRLAGTLGLLVGTFVALTTGWILATHALFSDDLSYAVIIPTHIVAALAIAWATVLFGGMSESKLVALIIPLLSAPLATLLILGFVRAL